MQLSASVHRSPYRRVILLAATILSAIVLRDASSQEIVAPAGDSPEEEPPRFTVELIVFAYSDSISAGSEIFVPDRPPVDEYLQADPDQPAEGDTEFVFGDETENVPADEDVSGQSPAKVSGSAPDEPRQTAMREITGDDAQLRDIPLRAQIELHLLDSDEYTMDAIYNELVNLDAYNPIMRTAWTQTTHAKDISPAIQLRALGDPPPGLDGSVTLYQGRFVHLGVDLALDANPEDVRENAAANERQTATDKAIAYGDARMQNNANGGYDDAGGLSVQYRISEVRIMKSGDIRYYDHPRFGVIAKVSEVEDRDSPETGPDKAVSPGSD